MRSDAHVRAMDDPDDAGDGVVDPALLGLPLATVSAIVALNGLGWSSRQIAAALRTNKTTVRKYLADVPQVPCGCGRAAGHGGWCAARIAADPATRAHHDTLRFPGATPDRDAILTELWPTPMSSREILRRLNALPGEPLPIDRLRRRARQLGLRRPAGMQGAKPAPGGDPRAAAPLPPTPPPPPALPPPLPRPRPAGYSMFAAAGPDPRIAKVLTQIRTAGVGRVG